MFLARQPSETDIADFIERSLSLPLSYSAAGLLERPPTGYNVDEAAGIVGNGAVAFARAKRALVEWRHFGLEWVKLFPEKAPIEPGAVVAVLVRH